MNRALCQGGSSVLFRCGRRFIQRLQLLPQLRSVREIRAILGVQRIRIITTQAPLTECGGRPGRGFIERIVHGVVLTVS